jgi:cell pole-organizing protein PopZ
MTTSPNAQHEPTMEEILASIRKIISEDQPDAAKAAPAPAAAAPAPSPTPVRSALESASQNEADVLELTDEVRDEQPEVLVVPPPVPLENDIAFENIEAEPEPKPMDDLISDATRSAVGRAFAGLGREGPSPAPASGTGNTLEALFLRAIHDAFTPVLQEWVDNHYDEILERLKPMIREWMDDNLPALVEATVTREIRAAAPPRTRRR